MVLRGALLRRITLENPEIVKWFWIIHFKAMQLKRNKILFEQYST
jgi:hypothetical protein